MVKKDLTCIVCPVSCKMRVCENPAGSGQLEVEGAQCARGEKYALQEVTSPTRTVTSTVRIKNAALPRLSVKTAGPIPKDLVFSSVRELDNIEVTSPVKMGEVIIKDLLGTGVDVVATRSL